MGAKMDEVRGETLVPLDGRFKVGGWAARGVGARGSGGATYVMFACAARWRLTDKVGDGQNSLPSLSVRRLLLGCGQIAWHRARCAMPASCHAATCGRAAWHRAMLRAREPAPAFTILRCAA